MEPEDGPLVAEIEKYYSQLKAIEQGLGEFGVKDVDQTKFDPPWEPYVTDKIRPDYSSENRAMRDDVEGFNMNGFLYKSGFMCRDSVKAKPHKSLALAMWILEALDE